MGTGFFKFEEWVPGQHIKLVRNDDYWGEPVKLDSVTFKVVSEDLTRVAELRTGDSHISDPLSPSDVAEIENTDGLHVNTQGSVSLSYVGFNMEKNHLMTLGSAKQLIWRLTGRKSLMVFIMV